MQIKNDVLLTWITFSVVSTSAISVASLLTTCKILFPFPSTRCRLRRRLTISSFPSLASTAFLTLSSRTFLTSIDRDSFSSSSSELSSSSFCSSDLGRPPRLVVVSDPIRLLKPLKKLAFFNQLSVIITGNYHYNKWKARNWITYSALLFNLFQGVFLRKAREWRNQQKK